ncbi:MAG TPA: protein kinase [Chthoniobacterales bacterium]
MLTVEEIVECDLCGIASPRNFTTPGCLNCLLAAGFNEPRYESDNTRRFQHYELCLREDGAMHELGRGAMGITYLAVDENLGSRVALKIIGARYSRDAAVRERFRREARAAAQLRHPNVASVFHFGETPAAHCFYAMEFIEGETLEARLRRTGPLPVQLALAVATQVTRALHAAETGGLIHRDLKPSNIMLVSTESPSRDELLVKVIDFGLARNAETADLVHAGFSGTPDFASPEQFGSDAAPLDARSDIYSLGATLWYALTGEAPFPSRSPAVVTAAQLREVVPIEVLKLAKIPAPVVELLRRMLAIDPDERPQDAGQLLDAIQTAQNDIERSPRRRQQRLILATVVTLALGLTTYYALRQRGFYPHDNNPSQPTAHAVEPTASAANTHPSPPKSTTNAAAHEAYLKGRYFWNKRSLEGSQQAIEYLARAVELDPNYAQAYAGLSDALLSYAEREAIPHPEEMARGRAALQKALELDDTLAEAHASRGVNAMNFDYDWAEAEKELKRAMELDPNYATPHHWYAEVLVAQGRFDEAVTEIHKARELDPLSIAINCDVGKVLFYSRRYDEAIAELHETLKMDPYFDQARFWLASIYTVTRRYEEAIAEFQTIRHGAATFVWLVHPYLMTGRRAEADEIAQAMTQLDAEMRRADPERPLDVYAMIFLALAYGDKDRAFALFEEDYRNKPVALTSLKVDPRYDDDLRADSRFADLLRRVHLSP